MKNNIFDCKGYHSTVEFDPKTLTLCGKIEGINNLVSFENEDVNIIEIELLNIVDEYLKFCKMNGKELKKKYKGSFSIRISPFF